MNSLTRTSKLSEKDIAAIVVKHLEANGFKCRTEVVVTLPGHGQVPADIVACRAEPDGEFFSVIECKRRCDAELESQCRRWIPYANSVYAAYLIPKVHTKSLGARLRRMSAIAVFLVDDSCQLQLGKPGVWFAGDCKLLSAVFHSSDGSIDPPAGSAAAKRATPERTQWQEGTDYLRDNGAADCKTLRRQCPTLRTKTEHQMRKAIDAQQWLDVAYFGLPTQFSYIGERK